MSWYADTFTKDYLTIYAHRDASEARRHLAEVRRSIPLEPDWFILDLACGDGRYSRHLINSGYTRTISLDLSRDLLQEARRLEIDEAIRLSLVNADKRHIPFSPRSFHLVLSLFTSFGYFDADAENKAVIHSIADLLKPGGYFYLDFLNPNYVRQNLTPHSERELTGMRIVEKRGIAHDGQRVEKQIKVITGESVRHYFESVRLYTRDEIEAMLTAAGLAQLHCFGDYAHSLLTPDSPRQIFIAKKGPA